MISIKAQDNTLTLLCYITPYLLHKVDKSKMSRMRQSQALAKAKELLNPKLDATAFCVLAHRVPQSLTRFEGTRLRICVKDLYIESGHPRIYVDVYMQLLLHKFDKGVSKNYIRGMTMNTERTTLFLMCNLGIEIKRLFSYDNKDGDMIKMSANRSRKIISEIYQKQDMLNRSTELEKIIYIIDDKVNLHKLNIDKNDIDLYFKPFINRFYSIS